MNEIDTIIFDLGGVLLKGKPSSILDNRKNYSELISFFNNWEELDLGNITLEDKFNECNISSKYKDLLLKYYEKREINIELIKLIKVLKNNNYNIYILSDNNKESYDYYKNNKSFSNIDGWVVSSQYHTVKKDGKLFEILINKYNLDVNKCLFIDDNTINIDIAKQFGIKGILYEDNKKLYSKMKELDVNL